MLRLVLSYLAAAGVFLALDLVWLTVAAPILYRPHIGAIMADTVALVPAVAFYLIYIGGILALAILPAARGRAGWPTLIASAAIYGFSAYATYDLTNQATLKVWSWTVTVADLAWGTFVTTAAACAGFLVARNGSGR